MSSRPVYLFKYRANANQRYHFAVFIPHGQFTEISPLTPGASDCVGGLIHVVGAPMAGYTLDIKLKYDVKKTTTLKGVVSLATISDDLVKDTPADAGNEHASKKCRLIEIANQCPPPRASEDFKAPVNDTTNKRCQEWTMEYLRALVKAKLIPEHAVELAQAERDPPDFGVGLNPKPRPAVPATKISSKLS